MNQKPTKLTNGAGIEISRELLSLSGSALINRILDDRRPQALVRNFPGEDFFWIIKKIGETDCLPMLQLASEEQWQYLLDLEVWDKDLLREQKALTWLNHLVDADPKRLSDWLFADEKGLFALLLYRTAEVVIKESEEEPDLPEGYFTLDGMFYIRAFQPDDQATIEKLLRRLAKKDLERYQTLLYELASILPTEVEEELYRLRNGRIAEHGFLPVEEALAVYAPLDPDALDAEKPPLLPGALLEPNKAELIPLSPLLQIDRKSLIAGALSRITDPLLQDRLQLEFSGLCNRIIAAGAFEEIADPEILAAACRRAGGYLNIALEKLCGKDGETAARLIKNHPLLTVFRIGYGFAIHLRREALNWKRSSWFVGIGRDNDFWGTPWGETLSGLTAVRPRLFDGQGGSEPYRDFETLPDLDEGHRRLTQIQALDRILARLPQNRPEQGQMLIDCKSFHPLLFNRWARRILGHDPSLTPLTPMDAERLFLTLRKDEEKPPYRMPGFGELFVEDFMKGAYDFDAREADALREALSILWEFFQTEYENVAADDLEGRYSPFLHIL